jgi:hypothetical protein
LRVRRVCPPPKPAVDVLNFLGTDFPEKREQSLPRRDALHAVDQSSGSKYAQHAAPIEKITIIAIIRRELVPAQTVQQHPSTEGLGGSDKGVEQRPLPI